MFLGATVVPFDLRESILLFERSCQDKPIIRTIGNDHKNIVFNFGFILQVFKLLLFYDVSNDFVDFFTLNERYIPKDLMTSVYLTGLNFLSKSMNFKINQKVKLIAPLPYLKTSENMPMLRPPDLVAIDEIGEVLSLKSPETVEVRFRRGSFLIDIDKLEKVDI